MTSPTEKACTKCARVLPLETFARDAGRPDGLQRWCRECARAANRAWYAANRDRQIARVRARQVIDAAGS